MIKLKIRQSLHNPSWFAVNPCKEITEQLIPVLFMLGAFNEPKDGDREHGYPIRYMFNLADPWAVLTYNDHEGWELKKEDIYGVPVFHQLMNKIVLKEIPLHNQHYVDRHRYLNTRSARESR